VGFRKRRFETQLFVFIWPDTCVMPDHNLEKYRAVRSSRRGSRRSDRLPALGNTEFSKPRRSSRIADLVADGGAQAFSDTHRWETSRAGRCRCGQALGRNDVSAHNATALDSVPFPVVRAGTVSATSSESIGRSGSVSYSAPSSFVSSSSNHALT
jgi:hypothetical protein